MEDVCGWLLFFIVGQIVSGSLSLLVVLLQVLTRSSGDLVTPLEFYSFLATFILSAIVVVSLLRRFPKAVMATQVILMLQLLIGMFAMSGGLKGPSLYYFIWVIYFVKSTRVKETYGSAVTASE